jgi:hypothetical protein
MKPTPQQIIDATMADRELARALEEVAELAGVPPENRPALIESLKFYIVAQARCHAYRVELFSAAKINKSGKRIARAAKQLADAMAADQGTLEFIRLGIPEPRPQSLDDYRALTGRLAMAAKLAAASKDREPWRDFKTMVREWLIRDVAEAGGNLAQNQRHPERSKLIAALKLLAPFLPPEFSKNESFSTLRRIKRGVKKSEKRAEKS